MEVFFYLFSTMTRFHIYSAYYLVILFSFKNLCGDENSEDWPLIF
ncbi:hypothetical protein E2C01_016283 [Portunus trituberculatus]|uniref:Uncharacterized protein n=1 Tax=Portunus trituberculatus TaxID=210409 RepID=A0A5B7DQD5_PORTR|nr:hypothetical protein [Portunus trituberculatus]